MQKNYMKSDLKTNVEVKIFQEHLLIPVLNADLNALAHSS